MRIDAARRRSIGWLFALSAFCQLVILSYVVYSTEPLLFGWANVSRSALDVLAALAIPAVASAFCATLLLWLQAPPRADWAALGAAVIVCVSLLLKGYGLFIVTLAPPAGFLAYRMYRAAD